MNFLSALSSDQFKTQQSARESSIFYSLYVWVYPYVIRGLPCFNAHIDIRSKDMMKPLLSCINGRRIKNQKKPTAERFIIPTYTVLSSGFYLYIFLVFAHCANHSFRIRICCNKSFQISPTSDFELHYMINYSTETNNSILPLFM